MNPIVGGELKFVLTPLKIKKIVGKIPYVGKNFNRLSIYSSVQGSTSKRVAA
jgi:hypothetical protein